MELQEASAGPCGRLSKNGIMKKTLCILLCFLFLCAFPAAAAEETGICGDNLSWTVADGVLTVVSA